MVQTQSLKPSAFRSEAAFSWKPHSCVYPSWPFPGPVSARPASKLLDRNLLLRIRFEFIVMLLSGVAETELHLQSENRAALRRPGPACAIESPYRRFLRALSTESGY